MKNGISIRIEGMIGGLSLLSNKLVIIGKRCCTGFHEDDLTVFESHERHHGFRIRIVGKVNDGMGHTDFVVFKQDSLVFCLWGSFATCETKDIGLAHGDATDVRVEHAIVVNDLGECVDVSVVPGFVVCFYD